MKPDMTRPYVLDPGEVAVLWGEFDAGRFPGEYLCLRLVRSHERLRAMFAEACVRIALQSDALGRRAAGVDAPGADRV